MLTSQKTASRLGLLRRIVLICLKNTKGQVYLQKHLLSAPLYAGLWDFSVIGSVFAGESAIDAAARELFQQTGIKHARLHAVGSLPYIDSNGANLSATFFLAGPSSILPASNSAHAADSIFIDQYELEGLALHQQDMLTPELVWAIRAGWIFSRSTKYFWAES